MFFFYIILLYIIYMQIHYLLLIGNVFAYVIYYDYLSSFKFTYNFKLTIIFIAL